MIIYKTTNLATGKIYIGQDSHDDSRYLGSGKLLTRSIKKYGKENFEKQILCWCNSKEQLDYYEKLYIKILNSKLPFGYNMTDGDGVDTFSTNPNKEEIREKMRKAKLGKNNPQYGKVGYWNGKKRPDQSEKMSGLNNPMKNLEVVEKLFKKLKGKKKPNLSKKMKGIKRGPYKKKWKESNV
jgi:group I intron endonuclease